MRQTNFVESKLKLGDLGCYDGPPIAQCPTADRLKANAISGSKRLASTINFLGLRP